MPNRPSAFRDLRRSRARAERNRQVLLRLRYLIRQCRHHLAGRDLAGGRTAVAAATKALDRAVRAGVVTMAHASRRKSRLMRQLNRLARPSASAPRA